MHPKRVAAWQALTILSLTVGYGGYYVCRSDLSVATPLLLAEFGAHGLDKQHIGTIASVGVFLYAVGKTCSGLLCDFLGGRRLFLMGMLASVAATIFFGCGTGMAVFITAWSLNRLVQSTGWSALVKVTANWFSFERYGSVMGVLSLSWLLGDAFARLVLGKLIADGLGWRGVFFTAAAILLVVWIFCSLTLKETPEEVGAPSVEVNPENLFGEGGQMMRAPSLKEQLSPFFSSPAFWVVAAMSFNMTLIRETFNLWTPQYLMDVASLSSADAASWSSLFPIFGAASVLAAGYLSDHIFRGHRGLVVVLSYLALTAALIAMAWHPAGSGASLHLALLSLSAFLLIGPYSFLGGAMSLDLGGKRGGATAAGLVDCAGYLGAMLSGWGVGTVAQHHGWGAAFGLLAAVALLTSAFGLHYWLRHERQT